MTFRISGVPPEAFAPLYHLDDAALLARGARRYIADEKPGFPDRVEMRDLEPGESALLVNYVHQDADTPRASIVRSRLRSPGPVRPASSRARTRTAPSRARAGRR